jgi:polysaccharide biosynthesis/export protein
MNKFQSTTVFLLALSLFSNLLVSQDLSKDFLASLPKSIQNDFLQNQSSDELASDNFGDRPDTRLSKLESGIDSIKAQVETMETELNRKETEDDQKIFGTNFFNSYQSSFAPINQLNFAADYVLDVGDVLNIQSPGTTSMMGTKQKVVVARDGSINIPQVGQITVAGMPFEEAISSIKELAKSKYLNMDLYINLEQSRDMSILLIGNASKPGVYTMPGGSSVLALLHAAGGIGENGSYRRILHKRNNVIIQEIDLYDVLIKGNLLFKSPLRSGDAVVVGAPEKMVGISGGINSPAIYELKQNENLEELMNLAQGLSASAHNSLQIFRVSGLTEEVDAKALDSIKLDNGDSVKVPLFAPLTKQTFTVTLEGAVQKPGTYSFEYGDTLHDIIKEAGGYLDSAYPEGGALYRKKVAEVQEEYFNKTYNALISYLSSASSSAGTTAGMGVSTNQNLQLILSELKNAKYSGRLSADFNSARVAKDTLKDTLLADGDRVSIPYFAAEIYVSGDVLSPGGRKYVSGTSLKDYIDQSGGFGRFADSDRVIIINPNGDAQVFKSKFFLQSDPDIYPGSTIYVPREIGKLQGITLTATLAPIVSSLALSLASLNSIR